MLGGVGARSLRVRRLEMGRLDGRRSDMRLGMGLRALRLRLALSLGALRLLGLLLFTPLCLRLALGRRTLCLLGLLHARLRFGMLGLGPALGLGALC